MCAQKQNQHTTECVEIKPVFPVALCDHLAVMDSEMMNSDDDGAALAVKDVGGVALDLHCRSCI